MTGSIAKAGSFRGPALIVPAGVDAGLIAVAFRGRGIFVEGPITVPAAAAFAEPAPTEETHTSSAVKLRVHTILGGRYYKAGEEVPDDQPTIAKYAVTASEDGDAADTPHLRPKARLPKTRKTKA